MFSYFKKSEKNLLREVYLLAQCLVLLNLIAERRVYICHQKMKSMGIFFLQFFESFRGKYKLKNIYSWGNEEWIDSETATSTSDYVLM